MPVNGIIAEYNPFHNGHKYQLEESRRRTKADYTVVVMSGNFVQRGAPALLDKHRRAEMALRGGADLVLELPGLYAVSSAESFALGAVSLLDRLGVVTHLCFGSECGEIGLLRQLAEYLSEEPEEYRAALKSLLKLGYSYPNARARAVRECSSFGEECGELLSSPNNILGIDYIRALLNRQSKIIPVTVKRQGQGYHGRLCDIARPEEPVSALAIRESLYSGKETGQAVSHMPEEAGRILSAYLDGAKPVCANDFSSILYYKLLTEREYGYEKYLDVSPNLSDRIRNRLDKFTGFEAFCDLLKTKEMTYTRISRCLLHILLGIEKEHFELGKTLDYISYARVLGFRRSAAPLLGAVKKHSGIPLITKLADAKKSLSESSDRLLRQEILSDEIYHGIVAGLSGKPAANEFTTPLVIV